MINKRIETAIVRSRLFADIRTFFAAKKHIEAETPILAPFRIPESPIEIFKTRFESSFHPERELCLIPSPELWMKRLLSEGFPSCYQITKCFRNSEQLGQHHNPEFTMLEWYSIDADYLDNMEMTLELLASLELYKNSAIDESTAVKLSVKDAFFEYLEIDLDECRDVSVFKKKAANAGLTVDGTTWEEIFNKLFLGYIEPKFVSIPLLFLFDYPVRIPCLAKAREGSLYNERWELYIYGVEIANCFSEETDPLCIDEFITAEKEAIAAREVFPVDEKLSEISAAMPRCSGAALGIDRLLMALGDYRDIKEVLLFPFTDNFL